MTGSIVSGGHAGVWFTHVMRKVNGAEIRYASRGNGPDPADRPYLALAISATCHARRIARVAALDGAYMDFLMACSALPEQQTDAHQGTRAL